MEANIYAAWIAFVAGGIAGAVPGMFFHEDDWLGGYGSWRRRMIRLAHISFFGLGALNLAFALTVRALGITEGITLASVLLIVGVIAMSAVCYLSAWKPVFRNVFFVPASSVIVAMALIAWRIML